MSLRSEYLNTVWLGCSMPVTGMANSLYVTHQRLFVKIRAIYWGGRQLLGAEFLTPNVERPPASLLIPKSIQKLKRDFVYTRSIGKKCEVGEPVSIITDWQRGLKA